MGDRRKLYRQAGRTFRYPIYVAIELTWLSVSTYAFVRDLWLAPGQTIEPILATLVGLTLIHSARLTFVQPWQLFKAVVLGAAIYVAAFGLGRLTSAPYDPLVISVIVASAYYFWLAEMWTRNTAAQNTASLMDRE